MVSESQISWPAKQVWLSIPDIAEQTGMSMNQVRRLVEVKSLAAVRIDGIPRVPADFFIDGEPMKELRGTLILLADSGYSDDEAVHWLLSEEPILNTTPIAALAAGRKTEVRRVAQALGF